MTHGPSAWFRRLLATSRTLVAQTTACSLRSTANTAGLATVALYLCHSSNLRIPQSHLNCLPAVLSPHQLPPSIAHLPPHSCSDRSRYTDRTTLAAHTAHYVRGYESSVASVTKLSLRPSPPPSTHHTTSKRQDDPCETHSETLEAPRARRCTLASAVQPFSERCLSETQLSPVRTEPPGYPDIRVESQGRDQGRGGKAFPQLELGLVSVVIVAVT